MTQRESIEAAANMIVSATEETVDRWFFQKPGDILWTDCMVVAMDQFLTLARIFGADIKGAHLRALELVDHRGGAR